MIAAEAFITEPVRSIARVGTGHINTSFLVRAEKDYILQRLNADLFGPRLSALRDNYLLYRRACEEVSQDPEEWICPVWLEDREGEFFHADGEGGIWRMYQYIPGDRPPAAPGHDEKATDQSHASPPHRWTQDHKAGSAEPTSFTERNQLCAPGAQAACEIAEDAASVVYEIGRGLGRMHRILSACDSRKIVPAIPHLFDLHHYYREYQARRAVRDSRNPRIKELEEKIERQIDPMLSIRIPDDGIIHGDAKLDNMIFRGGKVVGFIDLDTIMPGSVFDDLADCLRSCGCANGKRDKERMFRLIRGYEEGAGVSFAADAIALVERNIERHCFMLGLRYYTDYLGGNTYFTEAYPGQNLEKAYRLIGQFW